MKNKNIIRVVKGAENPYIVIDKQFTERADLSWKAKGILTYLLGRPDHWETNIEHLKTVSRDGRDGTAAGLRELKDKGYIKITITRDKLQKITKYEYRIYERPYGQTLPQTDLPETALPLTANPTQVNNDPLVNNELSKCADKKPSAITVVFKHWNEKTYLRKHKEKSIKNNYKHKHEDIIDEHGIDNILKAIDNYDIICGGNGEYWWTHRTWTLWEFLIRGINRFLPDAHPLKSMLKIKNQETPKPARKKFEGDHIG